VLSFLIVFMQTSHLVFTCASTSILTEAFALAWTVKEVPKRM
jgi:hypothetical protein